MNALQAWVATRVAVVVLVLVAARQAVGDARPSFLERWDSWDASLFIKVAKYGYDGYPQHYPDKDVEAFFPGFPMVLRAAHLVIPSWVAAGLVVSFVAGAFAVRALARLAALDGTDGDRAALYLMLSPCAVFLAAGYSEALFLALALPAWLAARQNRWPTAALLAAAACTVRVSGAFLAVALVVQWYTTSRNWRVAPWLAAPFLALLGYAAYLWWLTGDWLRWQHAQAGGWGRHATWPWDALRATWTTSRDPNLLPEFRWGFKAEIVAVLFGLLLTVLLLARKRWGEATYVGLSVGALASSTVFLSVARATLLWFPLWILLAEAASRRPWVHHAYLVVAIPLMGLSVVTFTDGRWAG